MAEKLALSFITLLTLLLLAVSAGEVTSEDWNRKFTGAGKAIANSVQQTSDGCYILAGETYNPNQYRWIVKTDAWVINNGTGYKIGFVQELG